MIVGAAIVPSAPLLVPGVSASLADSVAAVCDAVDTVMERLPDADAAVLLAAGERDHGQHGGQGRDGPFAVYDADQVSLAGIGRPEVTARLRREPELLSAVAGATRYPLRQPASLPLSLGVLALHVGDIAAVPVAVPPDGAFDTLAETGAGIAEALTAAGVRAVVVAAGDLSAGLTQHSPLHAVAGARAWDDQAVAAVDDGRLDGLRRIGPAEARRVGALAWAPMSVLAGLVEKAKLGMVVRCYAAPRGVGYLVASGR